MTQANESASIKGHLWNTHPLFSFRGPCFWSVSRNMSVEKRFRRCVDPCQRCLTLDDTHDLCVMCLGEEHARSVLEGMECVHCEPFFCGKKAPLSVVPFSRENWGDHLPPRLGSSRCWGSEETEFAAIADEACEWVWEREKRGIFHLALDSGWREWTAGGRCIVCYIFWSSRMCFAGSWCASRDVELLEVIKHALLLGKPRVDARKRGSGSQ